MPLGPIMLDLDGTRLTAEEKTLLQHPLVGGVIYFSRNYESIEQIEQLSSTIREIRPEILIAVDQEGGRVQRFKEGFTRLPAMQRFLPLYRKNPASATTLIKDCGWLMASELLCVGIDFSFAPVLDVDDHHCSVIADRAFSNQPEQVIELASAFIDGMHEAGMAATGKHFPGHGNVNQDSHLTLPEDDRSMEDIASSDMLPFRQLASSLDAIMPAHIRFPQIDPEHPVGFSTYWLQDILRKQLQFSGVIFSDDLTMEGAAIAGSYSERAHLAIAAGCDMVLICNHRAGALEVIRTLEQQVSKGHRFSEKRLVSMQAKRKPSLRQLKDEQRWQRANAIMGAMTASN